MKDAARHWFVVGSGWVVLASLALILIALAFFRSGHPPASGIVVLLILFVVTPLATLATLMGLTASDSPDSGRQKTFYVMCGVNLAFTVFALLLLFFKLVLGKTV